MRITESKLRNIIRQVIRESMHPKDQELYSHYPDMAPAPGARHAAEGQRRQDLAFLLKHLPVKAGAMGIEDPVYSDDLYYVSDYTSPDQGEVEISRSEAEELLTQKLLELEQSGTLAPQLAQKMQKFSTEELVSYILDQGSPIGDFRL